MLSACCMSYACCISYTGRTICYFAQLASSCSGPVIDSCAARQGQAPAISQAGFVDLQAPPKCNRAPQHNSAALDKEESPVHSPGMHHSSDGTSTCSFNKWAQQHEIAMKQPPRTSSTLCCCNIATDTPAGNNQQVIHSSKPVKRPRLSSMIGTSIHSIIGSPADTRNMPGCQHTASTPALARAHVSGSEVAASTVFAHTAARMPMTPPCLAIPACVNACSQEAQQSLSGSEQGAAAHAASQGDETAKVHAMTRQEAPADAHSFQASERPHAERQCAWPADNAAAEVICSPPTRLKSQDASHGLQVWPKCCRLL